MEEPASGEPRGEADFSMVFPSARQLAALLRPLTALDDAATLSVDEGGVGVVCVSPSRVSMAKLTIPRKAFQEYVGAAGVAVDFRLEALLDGLEALGEYAVRLTLESNHGEHVLSASSRQSRVEVACEQPSSQPPNPRFEFEAECLVLLGELTRVVQTIYRGGHRNIGLTVTQRGLAATSDGLAYTIPALRISRSVEKVESHYSVEELRRFLDQKTQQRVAQLSFATSKPLSLTHLVPIRYSLSAASLEYYLAPIVVEEP